MSSTWAPIRNQTPIHFDLRDLSSITATLPCECDTNRTTTGTLIADGFLSLISASTVLVNLAFILTITLTRSLHTPTNKLLVSNAVIDLLVGLVVGPFHIVKHIQANCWQFSVVLCKLVQSFDIHLTTISIFHLTGVAAERYFRIVRVFWYERWVKRLIPPTIILFWLLPIPSTFGSIMADVHIENEFSRRTVWNIVNGNVSASLSQMRNRCGKQRPSDRGCVCSFWASRDFTTGTTFFQFFVPILVMIYFYVRIFIVAYRQAKKIETIKQSVAMSSNISISCESVSSDQSSSGPSSPPVTVRRALLFSKDIRMVRLCAVVFLAFVVCWTPYFIMMLLEAYCIGPNYRTDIQIYEPTEAEEEEQFYLAIGFYVSLWLGLANSVLNPVLIFGMVKNYRTAFKIMMHRKFTRLAKFLRITNPRSRRPLTVRLTSLNSVQGDSPEISNSRFFSRDGLLYK
ncbi:putative Trace amine-associated receptor 1 [Hypsibius exemplaris]|uniref:Trace amine-associated receptor 1 n=1 Tax=Hypsibius exemplaris TaxID=2072580 RepID=A0A1W0X887_HYPEX|nr:putative Trace amine-associated receptor 1 [Hypsibius exemplaris]